MSTAAPPILDPRFPLGAVGTLFRLSVARLVRGRRLVVLAMLFALPVALVIIARQYADDYKPADAEEMLVFFMIPHALVPLTALVFAAGMIADEVEEQTLTYLLIRPIPRWAIYSAKLAATLAVAAALSALGVAATYAAIAWGQPDTWDAMIPGRAWRTAALMGLATVAYGSLFGALGLVVRRALAVGVAYIVVFEGVFASIDFAVRKLTVMYYIRVLAERWLGVEVAEWTIDLDAAPSLRACLLTLLGASAVATLLAAVVFRTREFRVKTPDGG